jgi:hypothetical protein
MVDQSGLLLPWFLEMVAKQNEINSHTIMPTDLFKSDFTGDPPLKRTRGFRDGQIVSASATAAPDAGTSDCDSYPVMALIISDSVADYPNVLLCRSNSGAAHRRAGLPGFANGLRG